MAITGIKAINYRVTAVEASQTFFTEFGLPLEQTIDHQVIFNLADGARVHLLREESAHFKTTISVETVWGVNSPEQLSRLVDDLSADHSLSKDARGDYHFVTSDGLPVGLGLFERKPVLNAPDPVNAPGRIDRLNQWRKWRFRAQPKTINHVVYGVDDYKTTWDFFRRRLGFRLSDHSRGLGVFLRADAAPEHHNLFLANCHYHQPSQPSFQHACFGVEDIDELMAGANHMARLGHKSKLGLGRHRIASALFYYLDCPAGGEAEYGADTDYLDDGWVPREWDPKFGFIGWSTNLPPFMLEEAPRNVRLLESEDDVSIPDLAAYRERRPA